MINYDDFAKLDIRVGTITEAKKMDGADRLIVFSVDVGEEKDRQIISGIAEYYEEPESLTGKQVPVLVNLEPRKIKGVLSEGMILYVVGDEFLSTLEPGEKNIPPGTRIK